MDAFKSNPGDLTLDQLAKLTSISRGVLKNNLSALVSSGILCRAAQGKYRMTNDSDDFNDRNDSDCSGGAPDDQTSCPVQEVSGWDNQTPDISAMTGVTKVIEVTVSAETVEEDESSWLQKYEEPSLFSGIPGAELP